MENMNMKKRQIITITIMYIGVRIMKILKMKLKMYSKCKMYDLEKIIINKSNTNPNKINIIIIKKRMKMTI